MNADDRPVIDVRWYRRQFVVAVQFAQLLAVHDVGGRTGGAEVVVNLMRHGRAALREIEANARSIPHRHAGRLIVHVEVDVRAGLDALPGTELVLLVAATGYE